jgi:hypothetical protein
MKPQKKQAAPVANTGMIKDVNWMIKDMGMYKEPDRWEALCKYNLYKKLGWA